MSEEGGRLWGGRFCGKLDPRIDRINRSFGFDARLWREDVEGSVAWAKALERAGVLAAREAAAIRKGLAQVAREFETGSFVARETDEDVHTAVERRLTELIGDPARRLHTGRSRNDQVATDLLLWLRRACDGLLEGMRDLAGALLDVAEANRPVVLPAYTHLQRAQPVLLAHHMLAYAEMVARDRERVCAARGRAGLLPLGCGAAVGSGVAVDRRALAADLGFPAVARNSLDAVGSRDAALEFLAACAIAGVHLSRLGEEIVLWTSSEFGFARLSDTVSTGSSLLPQKRNPDGAELARGKAGRLLGGFVTLATALKGLPLAYNKDLQEDKQACFDAFDTLRAVLDALSATLPGLAFDADRCAAALRGGHLLAVELADHLVRMGMPFRTAHGAVGELVREAERRGVDVAALDLETMRGVVPGLGPDVAKALTVAAALGSKRAIGGTAPPRVKRELTAFRKRLSRW